MNRNLPNDVLDQFSADDTVNMDVYVDDCRCHCRTHFSVKDGLLNVHGRAIFDRLLIQGDLNLAGNADLLRLPDMLAATGSIDISDCPNLKVMPSKMYAGESIRMERANIRDLPGIMVADRDIVMNGCPNVIEIPEGIQATCLYAAGCSKLKSIASGLEFSLLDLSGAPITELPSNLTIKTELKLRSCASLTRIGEGASVASTIDIRGCDLLFTLPDSIQSSTVITDGMMLAWEWVIVPAMSGEEAGICLGRRAIEAFPHRHFKNLKRMQEPVVTVHQDGKGFSKGYAVGSLQTNSLRHGRNDFLQKLIHQHLKRETFVLSGPVEVKQLT